MPVDQHWPESKKLHCPSVQTYVHRKVHLKLYTVILYEVNRTNQTAVTIKASVEKYNYRRYLEVHVSSLWQLTILQNNWSVYVYVCARVWFSINVVIVYCVHMYYCVHVYRDIGIVIDNNFYGRKLLGRIHVTFQILLMRD